jgi:hypothetical protein
MVLIRTVCATLALAALFPGRASAVDKVPPSYDPPGGLAPAKVPQFVCLGWDDNGFADGMTWILDELKRRTNPAGRGNRATFDGTPVLNSFYMKGLVETEDEPQAVHATWKRAYAEGHEIGNHTYRHVAIDAENEIRRCDSTLESLGIPKSAMPGFRTPQLAIVVDVFNAVYKRGFLYDCTVEHHKGTVDSRFVWPYTLENGWHGSAFGALTLKYPGMWELPVHQFTNGATGFDYNAWTGGSSGADFLATMKSSLDFHMTTNRSPFLIGTHTDYYAANNAAFDGVSKAKLAERRKAIVDFLDYALSKPEVRIVRLIDVIHWMRNPVALDAPVRVLERTNSGLDSRSGMEMVRNGVLLSIRGVGHPSTGRFLANGRSAIQALPVSSRQQ